jgi:recombinational DNA repair protein (RecF pathway)
MHATTSFKVDEDNIALVQDLAKTRELSKIINHLLRQYRDGNSIASRERIQQLEALLKAKNEQYEALKREIAKPTEGV